MLVDNKYIYSYTINETIIFTFSDNIQFSARENFIKLLEY